MATKALSTIHELYDALAVFCGKRVRLTYENGVQQSGTVSVHDLNGTRDVRIAGHGGFPGEAVTVFEVMGANGRYAYHCDGPAAQGNGPLGRHGHAVGAAVIVEQVEGGPVRHYRCVGCGATADAPAEPAALPADLTCQGCGRSQPVKVAQSPDSSRRDGAR